MTITSTAWGYTPNEHAMAFDRCITLLVNAVCRNGNVLFNVGPDASGVIPPDQVARMKEIGQWLTSNGESIYGTRPGPYQPIDRVVGSTRKDNAIYLHIMSWPSDDLRLPALPCKVQSAKCLDGGTSIDFKQNDQGITLSVPAANRKPVDTVVKLELNQSAAEIPLIDTRGTPR